MIRMNRFKHGFLALLATALLAACSSGVPLDEPPPEDGSIRTDAGDGADVGSAGQSAVPGVDLNPAQTGDSTWQEAQQRIVYFDFDSYVIRPEAQAQIAAHARFLSAAPQRSVQLDGHTDERGGREYNLALGQKRAEAVRRALALLGVRDEQMEAVSFGKEQPAAEGSSEEAHAQNRRVEIHYR